MEVLLVVAAALLVLALVAAGTRQTSVVSVNDETRLPLGRADAERLSFGPLGSVPGSQMTQAGPGQVTLTSSWIPTWAFLIGILAFPLGLLLLLLVRESLLLHVRYLDVTGGTLVQVAGRTRRKTALEVGRIMERLPT